MVHGQRLLVEVVPLLELLERYNTTMLALLLVLQMWK
jgi:hypothetical protein